MSVSDRFISLSPRTFVRATSLISVFLAVCLRLSSFRRCSDSIWLEPIVALFSPVLSPWSLCTRDHFHREAIPLAPRALCSFFGR